MTLNRKGVTVGALHVSAKQTVIGSCENRCVARVKYTGTQAASRVLEIAGWPAGRVCERCAEEAVRVWVEMTKTSDERMAA